MLSEKSCVDYESVTFHRQNPPITSRGGHLTHICVVSNKWQKASSIEVLKMLPLACSHRQHFQVQSQRVFFYLDLAQASKFNFFFFPLSIVSVDLFHAYMYITHGQRKENMDCAKSTGFSTMLT